MDNAAYVALTRQVGLMKAMQVTANNIANLSTTGFRREDVLFAEMLVGQPDAPGTLAMTAARVRHTDMTQGPLRVTGGSLDFGLEGPGFFMVETPQGPRLTRAGAFSRSADGEMVTMDGLRVLDAGGAPIFLPPDAAAIAVAADGTLVDASPGITVGPHTPGSGDYVVDLPVDVSSCYWTATVGRRLTGSTVVGANTPEAAEISVITAVDWVTVPTTIPWGSPDPRGIRVGTRDSDGTPADHDFFLVVYCP